MQSTAKKVLVVESDEIVLVIVSHILTRNSYVVHTTTDTVNADKLLQHNDYSAVLVDVRAPNGGVEFLRSLEQRNPAILPRIILATPAVHDATIPRLNVHSVVKKPFELYALLDAVNDCAARA